MVNDYDGIKSIPVEGAEKKGKEYQGICHICFLFAIFYFVRNIMSILIFSSPIQAICIYLAYYVFPVFLIVCFYIYHKKQGLDQSFLGTILFLFLMAVMLPLLGSAIEILRKKFFSNVAVILPSEYFPIIIKFYDIFLFSVILIICGNFIKRELFFYLVSIGNICFYLFLETCFSTEGIPLPARKNWEDAKWAFASVYLILVLSLGYFALGIFMCKQYRKGIDIQ